ncbi:STM3941 family protein [Oceanobacillus sp. Castelsardo]|uniref:STM3941 family protein n=1 Tax=Oceanobacillus sp. Castelsardo TaxID=1851204 RepID=UPI000838FA42|nr:STM3941 family protein [Oceanobacillus sp. Castelsardo]
MENAQDLYFYSPKVKNFLLFIMVLVFTVFGGLICGVAYKEGDFFISSVGAFIALFFGLLILGIFKKILSPKPYLILTEEKLIISASSKNAVPIKWEDIKGYNIQNVHFNKFIEIMLQDEEKYRERMSNTTRKLNKLNDVMNYSPFAIAWGQIKRKDRDRLVYELDRLNRHANEFYNQLYDQMNADNKQQKSYRQVNGKYILKSYGFSLILTGVTFLFFIGRMMMIIYRFLLFRLYCIPLRESFMMSCWDSNLIIKRKSSRSYLDIFTSLGLPFMC